MPWNLLHIGFLSSPLKLLSKVKFFPELAENYQPILFVLKCPVWNLLDIGFFSASHFCHIIIVTSGEGSTADRSFWFALIATRRPLPSTLPSWFTCCLWNTNTQIQRQRPHIFLWTDQLFLPTVANSSFHVPKSDPSNYWIQKGRPL